MFAEPRLASSGSHKPPSRLNPITHSQSSQSNNYQKQIEDYVYQLQDAVGVGQFSKVFKGHHRITGDQVAIKVVEIAKITQPIFLTLLHNEIEILRSLNHRNLLELKSVYQTTNNIYLITEFCNQGDLKDIIQSKKTIPETQAIRIMKHLVKGLLFLQQNQITHRDIKPANILVSDGIPKFADFGFAITQQHSRNQKDSLEGFNVGTPLYMAPETLLKNQYTEKTDLWALGCVFYEMLYGHVPFHSSQHANLVKKVKHYMETKILPLPRDSLVSAYSIDLLQRLLDPEPAKRMSLNELISHPAIAGSPTERIMKSESDELTRTSKSCEKRFETKPCNPANDSRERSITPLRNPIPSKHVPQSNSCSTPFPSKEGNITFPARQPQKSLITRPGIKIHPNTLKYERCATNLCSFLEQFTNLLVEDGFFTQLEEYVASKRNINDQEILQLCDFKQKLQYITNKLQLALQLQYGVQQENLIKYQQSLDRKMITTEMLRDQQFEGVVILETVLSTSLLRLYHQYLKLCILCFNKYLTKQLEGGDVKQAGISIVRLDFVIVAYQIINLLVVHINDFGEFYKLSEIDRLTRLRVQDNINIGHWLDLKKKIASLNLD